MSQQSAKTCQSALRLRLDQVHDLAAAIPASYLDGFLPLNEDNGEF